MTENQEKIVPFKFKKGEERARAAGRKGALAKHKIDLQKKTFREWLAAMMDERAPGKQPMTHAQRVIVKLLKAAEAGSVKAAVALFNLSGEMVQKVDVQNLPIIRDDIPRAPDPVPQT